MRLKDLFPEYNGEKNPEISNITSHSKEVKNGSLFLCTKGLTVDRHEFLEEAINNGAVAAVVSKIMEVDVPQILVENPNEIVDDIAEKFYQYPTKSLQIIGVTGTDGKTSCASLIQHFLGDDICGYIGTNGVSCRNYKAHDVHNTTPDKLYLLKYFAAFRDLGCRYVVMEASSEAFYYHRLRGIVFDRAGISNVTSEHLNTHKTLENYIACKQQLFKQNRSYSILNKDDSYFTDFLKVASSVLTYGIGKDNDLQIKNYQLFSNHTDVCFCYQGKEYTFFSPLLGDFNVENLAESFLICLSLGVPMSTLIERVKSAKISGRMETVNLGQNFSVIVDYAHTPNGVKRFFAFVKKLKHRRIIAVSGQAGERDKGKRKDVGEAIARNADIVYFTAEDPRHEKVADIVRDMCENISDLHNYQMVENREEAIQQAIQIAQEDDIVVILGKGAETTQTIGDKDIYFSDIECAKQAILKKGE